MQVKFRKNSSTLIASIHGELDQHQADIIRDKLEREIENTSSKNLILDLKQLELMDSSGIGIIIGRYKYIKSKGGKLYIVCVNKHIRRILEISGLMKIIPVYDTVDCALKNT